MSTADCVFCKIAHGKDEKTTLLYQDEQVVVFRDIRPAAEHHYLICPREHIPNLFIIPIAKFVMDGPSVRRSLFNSVYRFGDILRRSDESAVIFPVKNLLDIGKQVLQEQKADLGKARFGFHWPPFNMINHLHLHAISPSDGIRTLYWLTGAFSPGMPWFKSVDYVIEWLRTTGDANVIADVVVPTGASPCTDDKASGSKDETKAAEAASS